VRSADGGGHWSAVGLAVAPFGCSSLAVAATTSATVYAGSLGGGVLASRDGGLSWSAVGDGLGSPLVTELAVDASGTDLHAGTIGEGVFEFTTALPTCLASLTTACLHGGRFAVRGTYRTAIGLAGEGHVVPITDDTTYFWFFSPNNVEVLLKVLDGCFLNDHFWVFAAGLTDVKTLLTVTDTATGKVRTYVSPAGTAFPPIQDASAFSTCP